MKRRVKAEVEVFAALILLTAAGFVCAAGLQTLSQTVSIERAAASARITTHASTRERVRSGHQTPFDKLRVNGACSELPQR